MINNDYIKELLNKAEEVIAETEEVITEVKTEETTKETTKETGDILDFTATEETKEDKYKEELQKMKAKVLQIAEEQKLETIESIEFERLGNWLYIKGNTYKIKEHLKSAGLKYCSGKKCWLYIPSGAESKTWKNKKHYTFEQIRNMHPSEDLYL